MVELEEAGYLEQPHTSAGRVPTDRGYRRYVDTVIEVTRPSLESLRRIQDVLHLEELEELDQFMARISGVLSELAQQVGFVVVPTVKQSTVKQIELVSLSARKILCVLIAHEEMLSSHIVEVDEPITRDELLALGRFVNTELVGLPFCNLLASLERRLLTETDSFYHLVKRSLAILQHALATEPTDRFFLEGARYVLAQPEFARDPDKIREFFSQLDARELLVQCLRRDIAADGMRIRIGREIPLAGFAECSYVTASFLIGREAVGGLGVIGSKRMDYQGISSLVAAAARLTTQILSRWEIS